jgi:hypothetical protein
MQRIYVAVVGDLEGMKQIVPNPGEAAERAEARCEHTVQAASGFRIFTTAVRTKVP